MRRGSLAAHALQPHDAVMLDLSRLRRYSRRPSVTLGGFAGPLYDINSHGADALANMPSTAR